MADHVFYSRTSGTRVIGGVPLSMGRSGMHRVRHGGVSDGHRNDRSTHDEGFRGAGNYDGEWNQRAVLSLLDRVRLAVVLARRLGADASKIPSSQSSVDFLIGIVFTPTNPASFSHLPVSDVE